MCKGSAPKRLAVGKGGRLVTAGLWCFSDTRVGYFLKSGWSQKGLQVALQPSDHPTRKS